MQIFTNYPVLVPLAVLLANDILKAVIENIQNKSFSWRFFRSGGMPSGHSAFTASLIVLAWQIKGVQSLEFAMAVVIGIVVMYDATHIRAEAGLHAAILNRTQKKIQLEERLGHTQIQVLIGLLVGGGLSFLLLNF